MTRRQSWLVSARVAGYHGDAAGYTRLLCEARVARPALAREWRRGADMRAAGVPCDCLRCREKARPALTGGG